MIIQTLTMIKFTPQCKKTTPLMIVFTLLQSSFVPSIYNVIIVTVTISVIATVTLAMIHASFDYDITSMH